MTQATLSPTSTSAEETTFADLVANGNLKMYYTHPRGGMGGFAGCCGAAWYEKNREGEYHLRASDLTTRAEASLNEEMYFINPTGIDDYAKRYRNRWGEDLHNASKKYMGNSRLIFAVPDSTPEELLPIFYTEKFRKEHPVQTLQLDDPDGSLTLMWVDE